MPRKKSAAIEHVVFHMRASGSSNSSSHHTWGSEEQRKGEVSAEAAR